MITHPTLIADPGRIKSNIRKMAAKARVSNSEFRPHFKTHQSRQIGSWFKDEGVKGITVSSIKMAEYFASDGWDDITVAVPLNIRALEDIKALSKMIHLKLLAVDSTVLHSLDKSLNEEIGIYIELDPEYGRSGVPLDDHNTIRKLLDTIEHSEHFYPCGFYAHAGHSYKARGESEILGVVDPLLKKIFDLKSRYDLSVCFGDTPSCSVLEDFSGIDQVSPGNFVFYDWMQTQIGSCAVPQISIALFTPVLAKYDRRFEILIHGGAVHLSKEYILNEEGDPCFGIAAELKGNKWGDPIPQTYLRSVSQEHGILNCTKEYYDQVSVGDLIPILPVHSCLTADLMGSYLTIEGDYLDHLSASAK